MGGRSPRNGTATDRARRTIMGRERWIELGDIVVAEGSVQTAVYAGPVTLSIQREHIGLLDLRVEHGHVANVGFGGVIPARDEEFQQAIVALLVEQGKLDPGDGYRLESAETGMQESDVAVFECLERNGRSLDREVSLRWGAVDKKAEFEAEMGCLQGARAAR
jgi:hypothetical protein